jgi:hypothetical protein
MPVCVSTVAVFVVSSILHMLLTYHRANYRRLPDEAAVAEAMRKHPASPGLYAVPYCVDPKEMKDPAVLERYEKGPVALIAVMKNGTPAMGKHLVQWLVLAFLVSFTAAYIARQTLAPGADGLQVLRITGAVAFAAYGYGYFTDAIWYGMPWSNAVRGLIDSFLYAFTTGLVFRFLWPGA